MHIFYTGYNLAENGRQVILHAVSEDRHGSVFKKKPHRIRIVSESSSRAAFEDIDFRDPYVVYNESEACFWMIVGTRLSQGPHWTRGCLALLTSPDLEYWSLESKPLYAPNDSMCPECPELFPLNGKWYLVYSRFAAPNPGTVYRLSDSPRGPFRTPRDGSAGRFDGRRWYAAKSCPKAKENSTRIFFGWIGDHCQEDGKWLWGGDMAIPREVSAREDGTLSIWPSKQVLDTVFSKQPLFQLSAFQLEASGCTNTRPVGEAKTDQPYMITFSIASTSAASFGVIFDADNDLSGCYLRFVQMLDSRFSVSLAMAPAPLDDFWADQYRLYLPRAIDGPEVVRHDNIRIDQPVTVLRFDNTIEVFVGGRCLSYRLPQRDSTRELGVNDIQEVSWFVEDGSVEILDFQVLPAR